MRITSRAMIVGLVLSLGLCVIAADTPQAPQIRQATEADAKNFFNGKDLTGWWGDMNLFHVENGEIVGKTEKGIKRNEFLKNAISVGDFRLVCKIKLVPNEADPKNSTGLMDGRREMKSMSMVALAQFATLTLRLPVIDQTALSGSYDFPFDLTQEETGRDSAPSIFTVMGDLGLKLESRKLPFDVLVIDAGEKVPVQN